MDTLLQFKRHNLELEDLVTSFVENELGRLDWAANWPMWKTKNPDYLGQIQRFFYRNHGETVDPAEIAQYIDNMILTRPGRWR